MSDDNNAVETNTTQQPRRKRPQHDLTACGRVPDTGVRYTPFMNQSGGNAVSDLYECPTCRPPRASRQKVLELRRAIWRALRAGGPSYDDARNAIKEVRDRKRFGGEG